ncbi:MAG: HAD family hydrolase [Cellulosilyticaceae bacterium]
MYSVILFDLDGTLTDPKEGITKCVQHALKHFDIHEPDLDHLVRFIGPPLQQAFISYYGFDTTQADQAIVKFRERFSTIGLFENGVYDGIPELLQQLCQSGKTLAVATSKPQIFAEKILEKYELSHYFKVVVGSELDGTRTLKADVIQAVFAQLGLTEDDKASTIMVGDRKHDIVGAKAYGIPSIGVTFGYAEEGELAQAGADYVLDTIDELKALLLSHNE